jgi:hypothetical protein
MGITKPVTHPGCWGENPDGSYKTGHSSGMLGRNPGWESQNRSLVRKAGEKIRTGVTKPVTHPGCWGENPDEISERRKI